jgi:hypothetical protein
MCARIVVDRSGVDMTLETLIIHSKRWTGRCYCKCATLLTYQETPDMSDIALASLDVQYFQRLKYIWIVTVEAILHILLEQIDSNKRIIFSERIMHDEEDK